MKYLVKSLKLSSFLIIITLSSSPEIFSQTNQNQALRGTVTDSETGEALPGVHVYLSETTAGATTNEDGSFDFIPNLNGSFKLVASFVGYNSETRAIYLDTGAESKNLEIELTPASREMEELEVKASNSEWQTYFSQFKEYFLGTSEFADETIIENAWSLNFEEEDNNLVARAPEPLVVSNYALGYKIEIDLVEFKWDRDRDSGLYVMHTRFNELETEETDEKEEWQENREVAYRGSFEHFLRSLYNDNLTANRFEPVVMDTNNRIKIQQPEPQESGGMNINVKSPGVNRANTKTYRLQGPIDILYGSNTGYSNTENRDRSRLVPMTNSGEFVVTQQGRLVNPSSLRVDGEWSEDRVANMLPVDYRLNE